MLSVLRHFGFLHIGVEAGIPRLPLRHTYSSTHPNLTYSLVLVEISASSASQLKTTLCYSTAHQDRRCILCTSGSNRSSAASPHRTAHHHADRAFSQRARSSGALAAQSGIAAGKPGPSDACKSEQRARWETAPRHCCVAVAGSRNFAPQVRREGMGDMPRPLFSACPRRQPAAPQTQSQTFHIFCLFS